MNEQPDRVAEFTAEIESMKLKAGGAEGEKRLLLLGVLAVGAGIVLAVIGGVQVVNAETLMDQQAYLATGAFLGIALMVAGAALFVRYSLARYLRFWMVRLVFESRANADRIVDAIERASGPR
ncbi:MAG: hypothetical protein IT195_10770 [Microthrixaceae bacterium]|nr:hypothetical protein [Microthrixaceae bacterium]